MFCCMYMLLKSLALPAGVYITELFPDLSLSVCMFSRVYICLYSYLIMAYILLEITGVFFSIVVLLKYKPARSMVRVPSVPLVQGDEYEVLVVYNISLLCYTKYIHLVILW